MKFLKAFGMFWYDLIIGDDWKLAVAVVLGLSVTGAVMASVHSSGGSLTPWTVFGAVLILVFFVITLLIDTRSKLKKR